MTMGRAWLCALLSYAAGCDTDQPLPGVSAPDLGPRDPWAPTGRTATVQFTPTERRKVDLLFMIDNSGSMDSMQNELKNRFPQLFKPFQDLAERGFYADLHVGVVTSDYGAGETGAPGCTPSGLRGGGDQGKLIAIGKKARADCQRPRGASYIEYVFGQSGPVYSNLPATQDLVETFTCMSSVGAQGCGFEHQLESVWAALAGGIPENRGFLRDDALLLVVLLTNEDDGSAPPDTDVFDKNKVMQYGSENSYSRQTRFGVTCGARQELPPYGDSHGPLDHCLPAPNPGGLAGPGKLYDVQRYIELFTLPRARGGLKDNPDDVVLIGIDAPAIPFQVIVSNPGTPAGSPYIVCDQLNESSNPPCVPVLQHSCVNENNRSFYGDPAVRLNAVISAVTNHAIASICADDYSPPLAYAGKFLLGAIGPGCIGDLLPRAPDDTLVTDCVVELTEEGGEPGRIGECDASAGNAPCWRVEPRDKCAGLSPDGVGVTIVGKPGQMWRTARAVCALP